MQLAERVTLLTSHRCRIDTVEQDSEGMNANITTRFHQKSEPLLILGIINHQRIFPVTAPQDYDLRLLMDSSMLQEAKAQVSWSVYTLEEPTAASLQNDGEMQLRTSGEAARCKGEQFEEAVKEGMKEEEAITFMGGNQNGDTIAMSEEEEEGSIQRRQS